jgi:aryl-alcohol dehydrogenase-like predicted oxidoreductase
MAALEDLVRSGKVRYVGVSDTPAWKVAQANVMAQFRSWSPFIGLQIEYSLLERSVEQELVPMAQELGARDHREGARQHGRAGRAGLGADATGRKLDHHRRTPG